MVRVGTGTQNMDGEEETQGDRIERKGQRVVLFGETGSWKLGSGLQNVETERDL